MLTHEVSMDLPIGVTDEEARLLLSMKLFEKGRATLGQSARLAGYSIRAYMELLGQHRIPVFNTSPGDLEEELRS